MRRSQEGNRSSVLENLLFVLLRVVCDSQGLTVEQVVPYFRYYSNSHFRTPTLQGCVQRKVSVVPPEQISIADFFPL